jgi:hypothetical protein
MPGLGALRYNLSLGFPALKPERSAGSSGKQIAVWLPARHYSGMFRNWTCFRGAGHVEGRCFYFWGL